MNSNEEKSQVLEMVGLYQTDPEAFEKKRHDMIHEMIENLPEKYRQRAYGIQFQVEMRLKRYRDPVVRMNAMMGMFWEQFEEFNRVLQDPNGVLAEREKREHASAKVLPMKERDVKH